MGRGGEGAGLRKKKGCEVTLQSQLAALAFHTPSFPYGRKGDVDASSNVLEMECVGEGAERVYCVEGSYDERDGYGCKESADQKADRGREEV